jgi:hypothetical protein
MTYVSVYFVLFITIGVPMLRAMDRVSIRMSLSNTRLGARCKRASVGAARAPLRARGKG